MGGYGQVGSVRFVQCCDSQKARNASNGAGDNFPLETK
jgi:hypothetical protein